MRKTATFLVVLLILGLINPSIMSAQEMDKQDEDSEIIVQEELPETPENLEKQQPEDQSDEKDSSDILDEGIENNTESTNEVSDENRESADGNIESTDGNNQPAEDVQGSENNDDSQGQENTTNQHLTGTPNEDQNEESNEESSETVEPSEEDVEKWESKVRMTFAPIVDKSNTSKLGHLRSGSTIYKTIGEPSSGISSNSYLNAVYYIKQQAKFNGETYYLISTEPSKTKGTIGWVKANEMSTHTHKTVNGKPKTLYVKGTGSAYSKAWGGSKDLVYKNMSSFKNQVFKVDLTEKVGSNTWYRGTLNGKRIWLHSSYVKNSAPTAVIEKSNTSKLGHLRSGSTIYKTIGDSSSGISSNNYLNAVYYIKQQAKLNGETYYLISTEPSRTKGTIGWVKEQEMSTHTHKTVDGKSKTFYFKGTGSAYSKAWGGSKDLVYKNMSSFKNQVFKVDLTETVGSNTWYRGTLNGKRIWLHSSYVTTSGPTVEKSNTSKLGHLRSGSTIYKTIGVPASAMNSKNYLNAVYYIKQQAKLNGETYYLISTEPSRTKGTIGWVKAKEMSTHAHKTLDKKDKVFLIKGTGSAYSKAWGGSKDLVIRNLSSFANKEFHVNLTETVGSNTWYRGTLNGKTTWLHEAYVITSNVVYENFDITLNEALSIQMKIKNPPPQSDKYRNLPGYVHRDYLTISNFGQITGDGVYLRTQPKFGNNISTNVSRGTKVVFLGEVTGDLHKGSTKWYKIKYNNKTLYVHSSLANPNAQEAKTTANLNVRAEPNSNSSTHVYGVIPSGTTVSIVKQYNKDWYEISYNTWRNATSADTKQYLDPNNNDLFQHLDLSASTGATASELNSYLKGKGILAGKGSAFIEGGKKHKVNELYLVSHALLETGNGTSKLANGKIEVGKNNAGNPVIVTSKNRNQLTDIKPTYNMFGINANDGKAEENGAIRAYKEGWDTPEKAIIGGAKFIGEDYIHNKYNQNTIYKMRWNPKAMADTGEFGKQYATDIAWATKQIPNLKNMYSIVENPIFQYNVVKYR